MRGTLLLAILNIKSSYIRAVEEPVQSPEDVPDTLRWWIGEEQAWRIKTFALDHDIHTYALKKVDNIIDVVSKNTGEHYGDVMDRHFLITIEDARDPASLAEAFSPTGLEPRVDYNKDRFVFWKPDQAAYWTQSFPK